MATLFMMLPRQSSPCGTGLMIIVPAGPARACVVDYSTTTRLSPDEPAVCWIAMLRYGTNGCGLAPSAGRRASSRCGRRQGRPDRRPVKDGEIEAGGVEMGGGSPRELNRARVPSTDSGTCRGAVVDDSVPQPVSNTEAVEAPQRVEPDVRLVCPSMSSRPPSESRYSRSRTPRIRRHEASTQLDARGAPDDPASCNSYVQGKANRTTCGAFCSG